MEEMASTAHNANDYVQQVVTSMAAHRTTVGMIDSETENLEDMAEQLQQTVNTFKL